MSLTMPQVPSKSMWLAKRLSMLLSDLVAQKCNLGCKTKKPNKVMLLTEELLEIMTRKRFQTFLKTGVVLLSPLEQVITKVLNPRKTVASREEKVDSTEKEVVTIMALLDSVEKEETTSAEEKVASKEEEVKREDLLNSQEKAVMTSAEEKKAPSSKEEEEVKEAVASEVEEKEEIEETLKEEKVEVSTEEVEETEEVASIEVKEALPNSAEVEIEAEAAEVVLTVTMLQEMMQMILKASDSVTHAVPPRSD